MMMKKTKKDAGEEDGIEEVHERNGRTSNISALLALRIMPINRSATFRWNLNSIKYIKTILY